MGRTPGYWVVETLIERALAALRDPSAFFAWLRTQPPGLAVPYCVVLLEALLSTALGIRILLQGDLPQSQRLRELLEQANVSTEALILAVLLVAPLSALLTWFLVWVPVRIGSGRAQRLWEVAAWSQLPHLVLVAAQGFLSLMVSISPAAINSLSFLAVLWSAWFVYAGVRDLAGGRAAPAAGLYGLLFLIPPILGLLLAAQSAPGDVVLS